MGPLFVKIVYLSPSAGLGGAERCLLDMMAAVRNSNPRAKLHLLTSTDGPLVERANLLQADVRVLPMPPELAEMGDSILRGPSRRQAIWNLGRQGIRSGWASWRYAQELSKTLVRIRPDLIHSNGIKFHLLSCLARAHAAPIIWHIHDFLSLRPLMARALRWASCRARGAIAVSRAVQKDAQQVLPNLPVEMVHNAIDAEEFSPRAGPGIDLDQLAGLPPAFPATVRVGLIATYARWKGHEVFLNAATEILGRRPRPPARFFIIGGPIYQTHGSQFSTDELRSFASTRMIQSHVGFIPFQDNPAAVYRALDIVVHASTQPEPFGRTIVEAMACAKPVIVAQAGGAGELFTHDHDALGVPPGNSTALAAAINRLMADSDLRQRLGHNARQTAVERFSRDRLGPQLLDVYRRLSNGAVAA